MRGGGACNNIIFLEFDPPLKRNHTWRAVSTEADTKQSGRRRDGAFERSEP